MRREEDAAARIWIGGGTGAGKTTTARVLAVRHGLRRFSTDSFWYAYDARWAQPRKTPDEQWLETSPEVRPPSSRRRHGG